MNIVNFIHKPDPRKPARIDSICFSAWICTIRTEKRDQAVRVARYLAIRANRETATLKLEN